MRRSVILVVAALSTVAVVATYVFLRGPAGEPYEALTSSQEDLVTVSDTRVFFAHQSVGGNILDGVPAVFESHGLAVPQVGELESAQTGDWLVHTRVGENGDPLGKIREFDAAVRDGLGEEIDVAILKLCYSDVLADTDLDEVFAAYTDTLEALERDYPDVAFVAATVPLSIKRSLVGTVKEWVGRGDRYGPEHNLAREKLNARLRAEYAEAGQLFDIASIESTTPDGERITGEYDGELYYSLDRAWAKDPGHLNPDGAKAAADGFLAVVAQSVRNA